MVPNDAHEEIPFYDQFKIIIDDYSNIIAEWITKDQIHPKAEGKVPLDDPDLMDHIRNSMIELADPEFRKNLTKIQTFGHDLFKAIFPGEVGEKFSNAYSKLECDIEQDIKRHKPVRRLRLIIQVHENSPVYTWPLEFLRYRHGEIFLAASEKIVMSRYASIKQSTSMRKLEPKAPPFNVLLVVCKPGKGSDYGGVTSVPVEKSLRDWVQAVSECLPKDEKIKVGVLGNLNENEIAQVKEYGFEVFQNSATHENLEKCLRDWHPDLLHFIGHGRFNDLIKKGELGLMSRGTDLELDFCGIDRLKDLFNKPDLKLVVLQACEGADPGWEKGFISLADEIYKLGIPAVVAMQYKIENICATRFTSGFYDRLRNNSDIDEAVQHGRSCILDGVGDNVLVFNMPVLFALAPLKLLIDVRNKERSEVQEWSGSIERLPVITLSDPLDKALLQVNLALKKLTCNCLTEDDIQRIHNNLKNTKELIVSYNPNEEEALSYIKLALDFLLLPVPNWEMVQSNLLSTRTRLREISLPDMMAKPLEGHIPAPPIFQRSKEKAWPDQAETSPSPAQPAIPPTAPQKSLAFEPMAQAVTTPNRVQPDVTQTQTGVQKSQGASWPGQTVAAEEHPTKFQARRMIRHIRRETRNI